MLVVVADQAQAHQRLAPVRDAELPLHEVTELLVAALVDSTIPRWA
jgi:hypothetical protein